MGACHIIYSLRPHLDPCGKCVGFLSGLAGAPHRIAGEPRGRKWLCASLSSSLLSSAGQRLVNERTGSDQVHCSSHQSVLNREKQTILLVLSQRYDHAHDPLERRLQDQHHQLHKLRKTDDVPASSWGVLIANDAVLSSPSSLLALSSSEEATWIQKLDELCAGLVGRCRR